MLLPAYAPVTDDSTHVKLQVSQEYLVHAKNKRLCSIKDYTETPAATFVLHNRTNFICHHFLLLSLVNLVSTHLDHFVFTLLVLDSDPSFVLDDEISHRNVLHHPDSPQSVFRPTLNFQS